MSEQIEKKLKVLLARILRVDAAAIDENASSETIESWDSLKHMKLILALEEEFDVVFDERQIVEMMSFSKILAALASTKGRT